MSRAEVDDPDTGEIAVAAPNRDVAAIVGTNLRRLRKARGLSLEGLAELSGVSRAMLGQIETAKSVPTVSLLWRVADALGIPVTTLVATEGEPSAVVITREGGSVLVASGGRYASRSLFPAGPLGRAVGFFELRIAASHREELPAAQLGTRHSLVVSEGRLIFIPGTGDPVALGEGDAVTFDASRPYALENADGNEATAYLVVTAPVT